MSRFRMCGIRTSALRGWQLPMRARHTADPGDIFIGKIWNSVNSLARDCSTGDSMNTIFKWAGGTSTHNEKNCHIFGCFAAYIVLDNCVCRGC